MHELQPPSVHEAWPVSLIGDSKWLFGRMCSCLSMTLPVSGWLQLTTVTLNKMKWVERLRTTNLLQTNDHGQISLANFLFLLLYLFMVTTELWSSSQLSLGERHSSTWTGCHSISEVPYTPPKGNSESPISLTCMSTWKNTHSPLVFPQVICKAFLTCRIAQQQSYHFNWRLRGRGLPGLPHSREIKSC